MKTDAMPDTHVMGDAELVELCLRGDRDAFGQIVARYQSTICAMAFSACGDMARSEDLGQEIFIRAWRNLGHLQEPGHFRAWLCGIARNVIHHSFREEARNPLAGSEPLEGNLTHCMDENTPPDQAISHEEAALLWRVLESLPCAYREPMVLFYRQDESVSRVAEVLEISEDNVRQRLSRGRAMLNDRLAKLVESGLRRLEPSSGFTVAVVTALPITGVQASAAGALATAAKGSGVKVAGLMGTTLAAITTILPILGGFAGLWGHIKTTRSPRERKFVLLTTLGLLAWVGVIMLIAVAAVRYRPINVAGRISDAVAVSLLWIALCGPLDAYTIWMGRRQRQIRLEQCNGTPMPEQKSAGQDLLLADASRRGFKITVAGSLGALISGTTGWLALLAYYARDTLALVTIALLAVTSWLAGTSAAVGRPKQFRRILVLVLWGLLVFNLAVANWCWASWSTGVPAHALPAHFAPAGINLLILVFFISVRAGWFLKNNLVPAQAIKAWATRALIAYSLLLVFGFGCFELARALERPLPMVTQIMSSDFQPDGSIRFESTLECPNDSNLDLKKYGFVNSDFVHVDKMFDQSGHSLTFTAAHEGNIFRYDITLNEPVRPGRRIVTRCQGIMTGQIHPLKSPGEYEFSEQHWPGNYMDTRRIEVYRLPPGAKLLKIEPSNISSRLRPDGRTELRLERLIPPGGNIAVQIRYALP